MPFSPGGPPSVCCLFTTLSSLVLTESKHQGHGRVLLEGAVQEAPGVGMAVTEHIWRGGCEHREGGDSDLLLEEVTLS